MTSPRGADAEFADLEIEFGQGDNLFGARQVADRLAAAFPGSQAAAQAPGIRGAACGRPQGGGEELRCGAPARRGPRRERTTRMRAAGGCGAGRGRDGRRAARNADGLVAGADTSGDSQVPLAESLALVESDPSPSNVLDHALLLLAAQQNDAAVAELQTLASQPETAAVALRLLGLLDLQAGRLDKAPQRFAELLATGKFADDCFYYLGLIAERLGDVPRAMRFYAQVQSGDNAVAALLRASKLLSRTARRPPRRSCSII